jgi:hypothetical protein
MGGTNGFRVTAICRAGREGRGRGTAIDAAPFSAHRPPGWPAHDEGENMKSRRITPPLLAAAAALTALPALAQRDGAPGNPPSTATQRALDGALGNRPTPPDGTPGNPPGTAVGRAVDRALGEAGPRRDAPDGAPGNPPGTAASRAMDRATGSNSSGAYPGNSGGAPSR